jgi:hypothetical protein
MLTIINQTRQESASREIVPAYYQNQDDTTKPCQLLTRADARIAKKMNKGRFICNGKKFRFHDQAPVALVEVLQKPSINSCCGISKREMLANNEIPVALNISPLEIMKAKEKVKAYPFVHDTRAVLAFGSWRSFTPQNTRIQLIK